MLKSCKYCNRIHDSKFDCGRKPKDNMYKKNTQAERFRNTSLWKHKRAEIYLRDKGFCQVCIRLRYMSEGMNQYEFKGIQVHHIIPLVEDYNKRLDNSNLLSLCTLHHDMAEKGKISRGEQLEIVKEQCR